MMEPADRNRIFVADLSTERTRLGKANVVRFARRPAADEARLRRNKSAVLLVPQANGLGDETPRVPRRLIAQGPSIQPLPLAIAPVEGAPPGSGAVRSDPFLCWTAPEGGPLSRADVSASMIASRSRKAAIEQGSASAAVSSFLSGMFW